MKQIFHKISPAGFHEQIDSRISFVPFYNFVEERSRLDKTVKREWYSILADKIKEHPELSAPVDENNIKDYCSLLELIYAAMTGFTEEEDELWGISVPGCMDIFYGTDALFSLLPDTSAIATIYDAGGSFKKTNKLFIDFLYSMILEKFYDFRSLVNPDIVHSFVHPVTGLMKYYHLDIDTSFSVIHAKDELPELNFLNLEDHVVNNSLIEYLSVVLPLNKFSFRGFNICRLVEVTDKYAVESIRQSIITGSMESPESCMSEVTLALKTLAGHQEIDIGLIPFIKLNGKLLMDFADLAKGILLQQARKEGMSDADLLALYNGYIDRPISRFYKIIPPLSGTPNVVTGLLERAGIRSFALLPVYYHNQLIGALEAFTRTEGILTEKGISRMDAALPHIAQLMKAEADIFASRVSQVVNERFTSIQSAVQWKFNEAAWHYLQSQYNMQPKAPMETILFRHVHPFYGSVDIRNSSTEANNAMMSDMREHLHILLESVNILHQKDDGNIALDKLFIKCQDSLESLNGVLTREDERRLNNFFAEDAIPLLKQIRITDESSAPIVDAYLESLDEETGKTSENTRNFETSMSYITQGVNNYMDLMKNELLEIYPSYFEKFRTDGVEYDIYVGQSIAPDIPFTISHLKKIRFLQLSSMASISRLTNSLLTQMPKTLYTTQLIFINADPIDICFRNDEKRFDVDGGYNIRYQVIKKRIDKVRIRNTDERLTQPGKIAIVYFNYEDAEEYEIYIRQLQNENVLKDDLESLALEDLQGVRGLRALRVGVNFV